MTRSQAPVVVTGLGASTPVGGDVASTWEALLAGQNGVRPLTEEWVADMPVRFGAPAAVDPAGALPRVQARRLDRSAQFAVVAGREAWTDAGFEGKAGDAGIDPDRLGVVCASGIGGLHTLLSNYDLLRDVGPGKVSPLAIPMLMPNSSAANVGLEFDARAGVHAPVSACSSGAEAIAHGSDMIRSGRADVVVAGGIEAVIHPLPIAAFAKMMALSKRNDEPERASRPFDRDRDGFVLGEGGALLVLESAEHAHARGARIYAELAGVGMSADAHHIAQPEPDGTGVVSAIRKALESAGLDPTEIGHINCHATSTPVGDAAESVALRKVFGEAISNVPVTAPKSMVGHLLGGTGAVEALVTILSMHHRLAPPTINIDNLDEEIQLDVIRGEPRKLDGGPDAAMSNSFGFGGHNVVLAFDRP
ncbi:beta-ketoacyl-[acyl-carrier-protein] synthase II [Actinobacteria bacterium YIM 96077]|uniref:3-oxoacyl-[acyl-carrier-protein] synthase 2 n=1 Tax=Phytoactinopolyspora halophila TaxID=1981511 RepID=A0A329QTK3_9ACTN|nr:beta-ketoacyl-ACP synthase II [Phytoactinopolyspora halophila]AYY13863.1 beta-ketoacyl-[acyl-carrier-protein] synthase II [Actinobacteria bacterium YIM 96077]RAW15593.1 beta-ketoacyl-[acyl-carrier-protein] synthase II [Phytoactinopolyspora halophila]